MSVSDQALDLRNLFLTSVHDAPLAIMSDTDAASSVPETKSDADTASRPAADTATSAGSSVGGKTEEATADPPAKINMEFIAEQEEVYNRLIEHHPTSVGKALSSQERDEKKLNHSTLVYGEIKFDSYGIAFEKIKNKYGGLQKPGGKFYDIGSGTGKPTFAAALLHDFDSCTGVEILEGLYSASLELLEIWNTEVVPDLPPAKQKTVVQFLNEDATKRDWSDADMWFANSTCFDEALMAKLATIADKMKVGTFCVTFTKRLPSAKWQVLEHQVYTMSWGNATVYIQKKVHL